MNVKELSEALGLRQAAAGGMEREVAGVYVCDLLSRVMSGCGAGDVWITGPDTPEHPCCCRAVRGCMYNHA